MNQLLGHHHVLRNERLLVLAFLLRQIVREYLSQVCLACLLEEFEEEIFVLDHENVELGLVEARMLELTLVHLAHASPVQIFARKEAEVVREAAVSPSMTIVRQSELAQLLFLPVVGLLLEVAAVLSLFVLMALVREILLLSHFLRSLV